LSGIRGEELRRTLQRHEVHMREQRHSKSKEKAPEQSHRADRCDGNTVPEIHSVRISAGLPAILRRLSSDSHANVETGP